jgi:hypothetical protein
MQSRAAGRLSAYSTRPGTTAAAAIRPANPGSPYGGLTGTGPLVSGPEARILPTTSSPTPATVSATTSRQRGERSRPSGSNRNGRVTPRAMAGAQPISRTSATTWPASASGRWPSSSEFSQGSKGMLSAQTSPEAAYSQPIGLAGRRRVRTSPTVA